MRNIVTRGQEEHLAHHLHAIRGDQAGDEITWFSPRLFEQMCDETAALQRELAAVEKAGYSEAAMKKLDQRISSIFETQYLTKLVTLFDQIRPQLAQYFAAKHAWKQEHPEDFQDDAGPVHSAVPAE